jgi:hypothetical protein
MTGLEGLAAAASAVSGVIGALGAIQAANAQAAAGEYNARIQERDALIADQNRKVAIETAEIASEDKRRDNRRVLAAMRAAYGTSGLEMAGSPLDVLEDTAVEQELDVQRIRFEGRARSREGAIQMLGLREGANLSRMEASAARTAGYIGAAGQLVGGVGTALTRMA